MTLAHFVYVAASIVFAGLLIYMVTYNIRLKHRLKNIIGDGAAPVSKEEGILIATEDKDHHKPHRTS